MIEEQYLDTAHLMNPLITILTNITYIELGNNHEVPSSHSRPVCCCINFIQYSFKEYLWKPLFHTCYVSLYFLVTKCTQTFPWFFHSSWTHHLHPPSKLYTVESIIYLDLNPHKPNPRLSLSYKNYAHHPQNHTLFLLLWQTRSIILVSRWNSRRCYRILCR